MKNNLQIIMALKKVKATDMSKATGIARSSISRLINNQTNKIEFSTIQKICDYLEVTPNDLFWDEVKLVAPSGKIRGDISVDENKNI